MNIEVILVDENDQRIGTAEKLAAHQSGKLHRAFSIFVFNSAGQALIQKRAEGKYHSGGLWSNTCCSHPRPGEDLLTAAVRRLQEEMSLTCELQEVYHFIYEIRFTNGLIEHEYNHVLIGKSDANPVISLEEAEAWQWLDVHQLSEDLKNNPDKYTYWFKVCWKEVLAKVQEQGLLAKHAAIA